MDKKTILQQKRQQILDITTQYGASNVRIFGSVARGQETEESDIDCLVELALDCTLLGVYKKIKTIIGSVEITNNQGKYFGLKSHSRLSPGLIKNALLISANESYQREEEDLEKLTGIKVSHSTLWAAVKEPIIVATKKVHSANLSQSRWFRRYLSILSF